MKTVFKSTTCLLCIFINILAVPLYICFVALQLFRACRNEIFFVKMEDALS